MIKNTESMRRVLNGFVLGALLLVAVWLVAGCVTTTGTQTPEMQRAAFCNSVSGTIEKMTLLNNAGRLSLGEVAAVDTLVSASTPYCTSTVVYAPTAALLAALDAVLLLQLSKGS